MTAPGLINTWIATKDKDGTRCQDLVLTWYRMRLGRYERAWEQAYGRAVLRQHSQAKLSRVLQHTEKTVRMLRIASFPPRVCNKYIHVNTSMYMFIYTCSMYVCMLYVCMYNIIHTTLHGTALLDYLSHLVEISMAIWTDLERLSRMCWSTGSMLCTSTLVITCMWRYFITQGHPECIDS